MSIVKRGVPERRVLHPREVEFAQPPLVGRIRLGPNDMQHAAPVDGRPWIGKDEIAVQTRRLEPLTIEMIHSERES